MKNTATYGVTKDNRVSVQVYPPFLSLPNLRIMRGISTHDVIMNIMNQQSPMNCQAKSTKDESTNAEISDNKLRQQINELERENLKLQAVIADVTEVNKRWQKYNNDRQIYVQRLLSTVQDQQEQLNKIMEQRLAPLKTDEMGVCQEHMCNSMVENVRLKEENEELKRRLEKAESEHKEILEFQIRAHKDDWEAEKNEKEQALKEREAALKEKDETLKATKELESKIKDLEKQIALLNTQDEGEERMVVLRKACHHCCKHHHVCDTEHCNIIVPASQINICPGRHAKTYRTSVHLPCSSNLLPRGTTLYFGDDLVMDGEREAKALSLDNALGEISVVNSECSVNDHENPQAGGKGAVSLTRRSSDPGFSERTRNNDVASSDSTVNPENHRRTCKSKSEDIEDASFSSLQKLSCSVVHSAPSSSSDVLSDSTYPGVVTLGFNNGLASVTSFSYSPEGGKTFSAEECLKNIKELSPPFLSSDWYVVGSDKISPEQSPESSRTQNPSRSVDGDKFDSIKYYPVPKADAMDEGMLTQTREDVMCPGCGKVFPPDKHLNFLDHFEECQQNYMDFKSSRGKRRY